MPDYPLGPDGQPISDIEPFPLPDVPTVLTCPDCGQYIWDLDLSEGFEYMVAQILQAKNAFRDHKGYDIHSSALYPGLTFQIKFAQARCSRGAETKEVNGRTCAFKERWTWTWHETFSGGSDVYILFGIKDDLVYPFALSQSEWLENSSADGRGGQLRITTCNEYSPCGRYASSFKRNRFWEFALERWPDGLLEKLNQETG